MHEGQECAAATRQAEWLLPPPPATILQRGPIVADSAQIRNSAKRRPPVPPGPCDTFLCERREEKGNPGPARIERQSERAIARPLAVFGDFNTEPLHGPCVIADRSSHQMVAYGNRFALAIA